jgi:hypothetical protein
VIEVKGGEVKSSQVKVHVSILSSRRVSLSSAIPLCSCSQSRTRTQTLNVSFEW